MKKYTLILTVAFVAILSTSTMFANPLPVENITIDNTKESIFINGDKLSQQTFHVKILNASQEIVVEEMIENQTDFIKQYRVSALKDGSYNLVITKKNCRITQPFNIQYSALSLSEADRRVKYFPTFSQKNNQFDISVFLDQIGTITVNILEEGKHKIFTQTYSDVSILHKRFSLNNIAEGMYKVEIIAGDEAFYYTIMQ